MVALDHHPAIVRKAGNNCQCRVGIKLIGWIDVGHAVGAVGKPFNDHIAVYAENFTH